jgi:hypothetical protein
MMSKTPTTWRGMLLPKPNRVKWTWKRYLLLAFSIALLLDSFFVPFHGNVDPGGAGEGMLAILLGARAASICELPLSVVISAAAVVALAFASDHRLLKSPSMIWTPLGIFLVLVVLFRGRGKRDQADANGGSANPDSGSVLHAGNSPD